MLRRGGRRYRPTGFQGATPSAPRTKRGDARAGRLARNRLFTRRFCDLMRLPLDSGSTAGGFSGSGAKRLFDPPEFKAGIFLSDQIGKLVKKPDCPVASRQVDRRHHLSPSILLSSGADRLKGFFVRRVMG